MNKHDSRYLAQATDTQSSLLQYEGKSMYAYLIYLKYNMLSDGAAQCGMTVEESATL